MEKSSKLSFLEVIKEEILEEVIAEVEETLEAIEGIEEDIETEIQMIALKEILEDLKLVLIVINKGISLGNVNNVNNIINSARKPR